MSRPSLDARPTRDVAGVVADMLGTSKSPGTEAKQQPRKRKTQQSQAEKPQAVKTEIPEKVETASLREKTSFALRPDIKRRLTELKLDLRVAGHRVTEAEIVELLIAEAIVDALATSLQASGHQKASRRKPS